MIWISTASHKFVYYIVLNSLISFNMLLMTYRYCALSTFYYGLWNKNETKRKRYNSENIYEPTDIRKSIILIYWIRHYREKHQRTLLNWNYQTEKDGLNEDIFSRMLINLDSDRPILLALWNLLRKLFSFRRGMPLSPGTRRPNRGGWPRGLEGLRPMQKETRMKRFYFDQRRLASMRS